MAWFCLFIAGISEIGWAMGLKYSEGFSKFWPSVATLGCMVVSFIFLSQALKTIPIGTGYAVWTGVGTIGTAILGIALFNEPRDAPRLFCIFLILVGIGGLKLLSSH